MQELVHQAVHPSLALSIVVLADLGAHDDDDAAGEKEERRKEETQG